MKNAQKLGLITLVSAMLIALCASMAHGQDIDIKILQKALRNGLGEKSNAGTQRVITLRQELKENRKTVVVGVIANNSPTPAGFRHGILVDVAKILGILKSWGWSSKVDRALIGEYYAEKKGADLEARPVFVCTVSSPTIERIDWNTVDVRQIPELVDDAKMDEMIK